MQLPAGELAEQVIQSVARNEYRFGNSCFDLVHDPIRSDEDDWNGVRGGG